MHDAFGRRSGLDLPGGGAIRYRYDAARRVTGISVSGPGGATFEASFDIDAAGRTSAVAIGGRTMGYVYDHRQRLAAVELPDGTRRDYGWNDAGDLVRIGAADVRHDEAGRPVAGPFGARAWDALGRMSTRGRAVPETLSYDAAGRLARVERPGRAAIVYTYDGDGRLVARTEGEVHEGFVWDGDDLIAERRGGASTRYIPGERAGERLGSIDAGGVPRYLVQGPDGATLAIVGADGALVASGLHEPFGALVGGPAKGDEALAAIDRFHYRGAFTDPATGLVHFAMRWYDPEAGVFCAPDPDAGDFMSPETLHRYAYLGGDPVNHVDPIGAQAHEWQTGATCLSAVCDLFQKGQIKAMGGVKNMLDGFDFAGAIERKGWNYDVWIKRVPGTNNVVTIFRDLHEKAEGPFGQTNISGNIVLKDPPAITQPLGGAVPQAPASPGHTSRIGSTLRAGYDQAKLGAQLYGKELTATITGLGGLSGTLGTSLGTLAVLPGGTAIIAGGVGVAGVIGYGVGSAINMIPGVGDAAQGVLISVMGYDKDQGAADRNAAAELKGPKTKEGEARTVAENLAKDTSPRPPEPSVAGGTLPIGEPVPPPTRDRPRHTGDEAGKDAGGGDGDDDDEDDEDDDQEGAPDVQDGDADANILSRVELRKVVVTFVHDEDVSAPGVRNIVHCDQTLTFWNVGALAPGYGKATMTSVCVASLNGSRGESSNAGTFSGGPNGVVTFADADTVVELRLSGGKTIAIPDAGTRQLPPDAFAGWPKDLP